MVYYQSKYRLELSFMLRFTESLEKNRKLSLIFFILGLVTTLMLLFFPVSPGPLILGDLVPAIAVLYNTLYFYITIRRKVKNGGPDYIDMKKGERKIMLARITSSVALLHFLFPSFVLL